MRVAGNSNVEDIARRIIATLKSEQTTPLDAIGDRAIAKAVQSVALVREWTHDTYPVEVSRYEADVDGQAKTVHRLTVYR